MTAKRRLDRRRHAIYELAGDLLLVYKPRGHREQEHDHPYGQRLTVLRGVLVVKRGGRTVELDSARRGLRIRAKQAHSTEALADTWLLVERLP